MKDRLNWLGFALTLAVLGLTVVPAFRDTWVQRLGYTVFFLGLAWTAALLLWPYVVRFRYRKPSLPDDWELEKAESFIDSGTDFLRITLTRPANEDGLEGGHLTVKCNRRVLNPRGVSAKIQVSRTDEWEPWQRVFPTIDQWGVVSLRIPQIQPYARFHITVTLDSDGPLRVHEVEYHSEK